MAEIVCPQEQYVTLGRLPIRITSDSGQLLEAMQDILRPRAERCGDAVFHLRLRYGLEPFGWRGGGLRLFWSGLLRGGITSEYYTSRGQRIAYLPGRAWGRLDFERREMEIACRPGQEGCVHDGCLTPLLCELLADHGH